MPCPNSRAATSSRRTFLKGAAVAAASTLLPRFAVGQSGPAAHRKLNLAFIGVGGRGSTLVNLMAGENFVAFCDVDDARAAETYTKYPEVPRFKDFRRMFDRMGSQIDAVAIATPDHTHFVATCTAMALGKHVFCEKPLTHNLWQARTLRKAAERFGVITAMGNQGHSQEGIRLYKEWYEAGAIGEAREVLVYNGGPKFGPGKHYTLPTRVPPTSQAVPETLNWSLWRGPVVDDVKYNEVYLPKTWRGFYRFGNGQMGDWGCHTLDAPFWTLGLGAPSKVEVLERGDAVDGMVPENSKIRFTFPREGRSPLLLTWHERIDPEIDPKWGIDSWEWGVRSAIVGEKGCLTANGYSNGPRLYPDPYWEEFRRHRPAEVYPRLKGNHADEWLRAIKGEGALPGSNFAYATRLTETVLLGAMAQRFDRTVEWDAEAMRVTNDDELNAFVKEPVRRGWEVGDELWS